MLKKFPQGNSNKKNVVKNHKMTVTVLMIIAILAFLAAATLYATGFSSATLILSILGFVTGLAAFFESLHDPEDNIDHRSNDSLADRCRD